jgi:hypothetical protein
MHNGVKIELLRTEKNLFDWTQKMVEAGCLNHIQLENIICDCNNCSIIDIQFYRDQCRAFLGDLGECKYLKPKFIELIEETIKENPVKFKVIYNHEQSKSHILPLSTKTATTGLLSIVAYDFLMLIEQNLLHYIKKCENDNCLAFFINTTGRRKWCSMKICGNRAKVAKHYYGNNK